MEVSMHKGFRRQVSRKMVGIIVNTENEMLNFTFKGGKNQEVEAQA